MRAKAPLSGFADSDGAACAIPALIKVIANKVRNGLECEAGFLDGMFTPN